VTRLDVKPALLPRLELLGGFRLAGADGRNLRLSGRKMRALLAILALAPAYSATRSRLRTMLWGSRGDQQAGDSLRQLLAALRKELHEVQPGFLVSRDDQIALDPGAIALDVAEFAEAAGRGDQRTAAALYRGPLLDGLDLGDEEFETWLAAERRDYQGRASLVFERLAASLTGAERVQAAERLVGLDPLRETAHRVLIASHLANDDAAAAKRQFETCRTVLRRELGVDPSPETAALLAQPPGTPEEPVRAPAQPATAPGQPSIAILPFANLSDDPAQRYFSEGISADIVTELSRFHQLLVRAHRRTAAADAISAGRELGVNYVAEGSVRRMGSRLRITVQLYDVDSGETLWSERFDAGEEEVFEVQDRIVRSIAAQIYERLRLAGLHKANRKPPNSLAAYDYLLRGDALPIGVPEAEMEARGHFQKAIDLDPSYGRAYAYLGEYTLLEWVRGLDAPVALLDRSLALAKEAVALDDGDEYCHAVLGRCYMFRRSFDLAQYHYQKALALNPNQPELQSVIGIFYGFFGDPARGLAHFREALVIDPHFDPTWYWRNRAVVHFIAHEYEEAIEGFRLSPIQPDWVEAHLAASSAYLGHMDEAHRHAAAVLALTPEFTIRAFVAKDPYRRPEDAEHLAEGLRRAGLPE